MNSPNRVLLKEYQTSFCKDGRKYLGEQEKSSKPPGICRSSWVYPSFTPLPPRDKTHQYDICSCSCPPPPLQEGLGDTKSFTDLSSQALKSMALVQSWWSLSSMPWSILPPFFSLINLLSGKEDGAGSNASLSFLFVLLKPKSWVCNPNGHY